MILEKKIFNDLGALIYNLNLNLINITLKKYFEFRNFFKNKNSETMSQKYYNFFLQI